jgi:hypothetical protein
MPAKGEKYTHNQIKDEVYTVASVSRGNSVVTLNPGGITVTYSQLAQNYTKVK